MKRPALWSLVFLIMGIFLGRYGFGSLCTVLFSVVSVVCALRTVKSAKLMAMLAVFSVLGFGLMVNAVNFGTENLNASAENGEDIRIKGIVKDKDVSARGYDRITLKLLSAENGEGRLIFDGEKNVNILIYTQYGEEIQYGSEAEAYVNLESLEGPENYGGFDSMVYNGARGIDYTFFAEDISFMPGKATFNSRIKTLRDRVCAVYDEALPPDESGIMKALVTGYRSSLSDSSKDLYKRAGIFHVLAISGLHISLIAGGIYFLLFEFFRLSGKRAAAISMALIALYAVFTGGSVPVVRGVIMFCALMTGKILGRNEDKINSLSLAAIIILFVSPLFLFDAGFLLSFTATLGVFAGLKILEKSYGEKDKGKRKRNFIYESIVISLTVLGFILPVMAYFFGEVSFYSVLTNIVVALTFPIIMVMGLISGFLGLISINAAVFFGGGAYFLLKLTEILSRGVIGLKYGIITSGRLSLFSNFFYICGLGTLILTFTGKIKAKAYVPLIFAAAFFVSLNANRWFFKNDEINFLSVGNGDSAVIKTFDNHVFVVDGGGNNQRNIGENTGKNIVLPFLTAKGIKNIDGVFISHLDSDHALGAIELMDLANVDAVYIPDSTAGEVYVWDKLYEGSVRNGVPVYKVRAGDKFPINEKAYIECIAPDEEKEFINSNEGSMVLKYVNGGFSALFTGDIGFGTEQNLIERGRDLSANVLKVPHHGSKYSSSEEFIEAVGNEISVVSAGKNNIYGHPSEEALERLSQTEIFITYETGSVRILTNGNGYKYETLKEGGVGYEALK